MKYSMNYYSKKSLGYKDTFIQEPEIYEPVIYRAKKRTTAGNTNTEKSSFQFVVPWQLP